MFFPTQSLCHHAVAVQSVLRKNEKVWLKRLLVWVKQYKFDGRFSLDDYFRYLSSLGFAHYPQEVCFLVKFLKETGIFISASKIRHWKSLYSHREENKSPGIPYSWQIVSLLQKIPIQEQLHVLIMVTSGRRFIDVSRIDSRKVTLLEGKFVVQIKKDKCSSSPVSFSFEFSDGDLSVDWNFYQSQFLAICQEKRFSFSNSNMQKIRREADYTLHATRHRKALSMIRNDTSIQDTLNFIGWRCNSSFERYTKLTVCDIKSFPSLDKTIEFINSFIF